VYYVENVNVIGCRVLLQKNNTEKKQRGMEKLSYFLAVRTVDARDV